jgi:hypothetical protein
MTTVENAEAGAQVDGAAAAALLAAGTGAFVLGLLTTLSEASESIHDFLEFSTKVGPLSGKTILAAIAYFGSLLVYWFVFRGRTFALRSIVIATAILLVLGFLGTFPTFFQAFA